MGETNIDKSNTISKPTVSQNKNTLMVAGAAAFVFVLLLTLVGVLMVINDSDEQQNVVNENESVQEQSDEQVVSEVDDNSQDIDTDEQTIQDEISEVNSYSNVNLPDFTFNYLPVWDIDVNETFAEKPIDIYDPESETILFPEYEITLSKNGVSLNIFLTHFSVGGWVPECFLKDDFEVEVLSEGQVYRLKANSQSETWNIDDIFYTNSMELGESEIQETLSYLYTDEQDNSQDYVGCGTLSASALFTNYNGSFVDSEEQSTALITFSVEGEGSLDEELLVEMDYIVKSVRN